MSEPLHPAYRFREEAQWQVCQFAGADRRTAEARAGLRPFAPYGLPSTLFESAGAHAPAITGGGEILWRDDEGGLQRLAYAEAAPRAYPAPAAIGAAVRMVALGGTLWAASGGGRLEAFDVDSLTRLFTVDLGGLAALDIAGDGHDGLYVLTAAGRERSIVHVDCTGTANFSFPLPGLPDASALVYLADAGRLVLLGSDGSKLHWFDAEGKAGLILPLLALRGCFDVAAIGGDGGARLFLAGTDGAAAGGGHRVLTVDADGGALGVVPVEARPTGVVANRAQLFVATAAGLRRFEPVATVPRGAGEIGAALLTPLLRSPADGPQRWIRIDAKADLPPGCSIEIAYAAAGDAEQRENLLARLADPSVPHARRLENWRRELTLRSLVFHGDPDPARAEKVFSVPLHDAVEDMIWVQVTLIAAPGGSVPSLRELDIYYPGPRLIEHLPAIYRRKELERGDFLRSLVGVLEAGTQDLDARIGELGRNIDPATAGGEWLDFVAGWLGLPWDEGLSVEQKRRLAGRAALIGAGYGTRAGLEALLDGLMPERPRRFRIVDLTADYGMATIGGGGCEGSRLPALLTGLPGSATELGNKAILGRARLPCGEPETGSARFVGRLRVDVAAAADERQAWSPWLPALIDAMLPVTARAELRWLGRNALARPDQLDEGLRLRSGPAARLGTDAITGGARLGGRRRTTLPGQLSEDSTLH